MSNQIRTRIAPSPTGEIHVGSMGILLRNYAFAKGKGGQFIIRIEDTDQEREVEGAQQRILEVIKDYGLSWDEGPDIGGPYAPYTQSERLPMYKAAAEELVAKDQAYYCFCSRERLAEVKADAIAANVPPKYDRHCRNLSREEVQSKLAAGSEFVIRLKVPDNVPIMVNDLIRGEITVNSDIIDDQVLLKSDGFPTYHLAVVVDDHAMKITHVLRGEEWISSTPKHVLLYQAFGWEQPVYAHMPVYLNPDGKGKMSKRKGTVSARSFLEAGFLPEALLNFFMILGWTPEDQREIMTLDEFIKEFDPKDVSAKSVVFDLEKLKWLNGVYIRNLSPEALKAKVTPYLPEDFPHDKYDEMMPLVMERLVTLKDIEELTAFFYRSIEVDPTLLLKKGTPELVKTELEATITVIESLREFSVAELETEVRQLQERHDWHKGQYFMMLRLAVTGRTATPPLFETMSVIGKDEVIARLKTAAQIAIT